MVYCKVYINLQCIYNPAYHYKVLCRRKCYFSMGGMYYIWTQQLHTPKPPAQLARGT